MRYVRVVKTATRANQHDRQSLVLVYVEKGKRRRMNTHFAENPVAIAKGWQPVQGAFKAEVEGDWTTFEPTAFQAMVDQLTDVIYCHLTRALGSYALWVKRDVSAQAQQRKLGFQAVQTPASPKERQSPEILVRDNCPTGRHQP